MAYFSAGETGMQWYHIFKLIKLKENQPRIICNKAIIPKGKRN